MENMENNIEINWNICIVGSGAIGCAFGGFLCHAGHKVTFIEKNENIINEIKKNGLTIFGIKDIHLKNVTILPPGSLKEKQDLILFAVKAYDLEDVVKNTLPIIGKNTYVVCLQNGFGISEIIKKYVDKDNIIECIVWFPATMIRPGYIELNAFYEECILGGNYSENIAFLLNSAGIPSKAVDNIEKEIWKKGILVTVGNSINALTRTKLGIASKIPELKESRIEMLKECLKAARAEGIELEEEIMIKSMNNAIEKGSEHKTSMLIDIINKRKTEVDFLNGKIIELGKKHNIPTPLNVLVYGVIKALEYGD